MSFDFALSYVLRKFLRTQRGLERPEIGGSGLRLHDPRCFLLTLHSHRGSITRRVGVLGLPAARLPDGQGVRPRRDEGGALGHWGAKIPRTPAPQHLYV